LSAEEQNNNNNNNNNNNKALAWDVTVPDTYAVFHLTNSAREACRSGSQPFCD